MEKEQAGEKVEWGVPLSEDELKKEGEANEEQQRKLEEERIKDPSKPRWKLHLKNPAKENQAVDLPPATLDR